MNVGVIGEARAALWPKRSDGVLRDTLKAQASEARLLGRQEPGTGARRAETQRRRRGASALRRGAEFYFHYDGRDARSDVLNFHGRERDDRERVPRGRDSLREEDDAQGGDGVIRRRDADDEL